MPRARSCGTLSIGIGWDLRASPNVRCSAARRVMLTYFRRFAGRTHPLLFGYRCAKRDLQDAKHIRCTRPGRLVTAKSFGY